MIMGIIGKSVKACHLMAIILVVSFCVLSIPIWNFNFNFVAAHQEKQSALTVVQQTNEQEAQGDGLVTVESNDDDDKVSEEANDELFEATHEWKNVKKGQNVPSGLHIRLNMQTGEREAKLMDSEPKENSKDSTTWFAGDKVGTIKSGRQQYSRDELKKALEDFKFDDQGPDSKSEKSDSPQSSQEKPFRSYEELKEMMKEMKMAIKTEAEIVTALIGDLKKSTDLEVMKTCLDDLEYYLHQVDNGHLFCDLDGMDVVGRLMNHSDEDIRTKAVWVLGSALQSNAKVQVQAVENGMLQQILRLMAIDTSTQVKKKTLFALSTLLRQFPYAQAKFVEAGGMSAVSNLFAKCEDENLKVKIITLLTDLVEEHDHQMSLEGDLDDVQSERSRQYAQVNIRRVVKQSGWCSNFAALLHDETSHDNVEKILSAITALYDTCQGDALELRSVFVNLSKQYGQLAAADREQGETDTFFAGIYTLLENLIHKIHLSREDL